MTRFFPLFWLALSIVCDANAALTMQVDFDQHADASATDPRAAMDAHVSQTLTLAEQRFVLDSPAETSIFIFRTRRRSVVDHATRTRVDYSRYDVIGFRVIEYGNRVRIAAAPATA